MTIRFSFAVILLCFLSFFSCENPASGAGGRKLNPQETFLEEDEPVTLDHDSFSFQSPWGYDKPDNASRVYPLLVSGMWGEGKGQYSSVAQDFPAFVIDYQKPSSSDGRILGEWIKSAIEAGYRIDSNRIYLTGFSYGGSSSYPLAKGLAEEDLYFAAILRMAGQSQSDLGNYIAEKTAVWYHIGLNDNETRVLVARQALANMRNYPCNTGAVETESFDDITGFERRTVTLTRSGYPMFKYSEYTGMGHSSGPCYRDESLFPWMFSHSLLYR